MRVCVCVFAHTLSMTRDICRPQAEGAFHFSETCRCTKRREAVSGQKRAGGRATAASTVYNCPFLKMICWNWSLTSLRDILLLTSQICKCFWPPPPSPPLSSSTTHLHHIHTANFLSRITGLLPREGQGHCVLPAERDRERGREKVCVCAGDWDGRSWCKRSQNESRDSQPCREAAGGVGCKHMAPQPEEINGSDCMRPVTGNRRM